MLDTRGPLAPGRNLVRDAGSIEPLLGVREAEADEVGKPRRETGTRAHDHEPHRRSSPPGHWPLCADSPVGADEDAEISASEFLKVESHRLEPVLRDVETMSAQIRDALWLGLPAAPRNEKGQ
jgi:hypothetical protein